MQGAQLVTIFNGTLIFFLPEIGNSDEINNMGSVENIFYNNQIGENAFCNVRNSHIYFYSRNYLGNL